MSKAPVNKFGENSTVSLDRRLAPEALKANLALVALLRKWAQRKGATPVQIALAWLLAQKPWIVPIPGTTQMAHLDENLGAIAVELTSGDLLEINAAASKSRCKGHVCLNPRWN